MRLLVRHGHFAFYPDKTADVSRYMKLFELELVRDGEFYTFPFLKDFPKYSIEGALLKNATANVTHEGKPWEILKANGLVYSLGSDLLVPAESVTTVISPTLSTDYYVAQGPIIQPGSRNALSQMVLSYDARYIIDLGQLRVLGFEYE